MNYFMLLLFAYTAVTLSMDTELPLFFEPSYKAAVFGQLKSLIRQGKWKKAFAYEPQIRKLHHNEWGKIVRYCAQYKQALERVEWMYQKPQVAQYFQAMKAELQEIAQTGVSFEADINTFRHKEFARWRNEYHVMPLTERMQAFALLQHWYYDQEQQLAAIQQSITAYAVTFSDADIFKYINKKRRGATLFWNRLDEIKKETWDKYVVGQDEITNTPIWEYTRKHGIAN